MYANEKQFYYLSEKYNEKYNFVILRAKIRKEKERK